jgi:hypothetical protein
VEVKKVSKPISLHPGATAPVGLGLLVIEASRSHSDTLQSVGIPWMSDRPDAETPTSQHTTLTRDRPPCPQRDSIPQFQQRKAADPRLRPCHWDRLSKSIVCVCFFSWRYKPMWLYFHSPVADFSLLVFEVSRSHTTTRQSQ